MIDNEAARERLLSFVRKASSDPHARIHSLELMTGGAIQQNWAIQAELHNAAQQWVMRMDAPARVAESLTRIDEFRVLQVMHERSVLAPQPLWSCDDPQVMGRPFFIMRRLPGVAAGHRLTRDASLIPDRARLARELACNLARIQSITASHPDLKFLKTTLARDNIARYRDCLDALAEPYPVLEWGLRWCEAHAPEEEDITFIHRDYRTGNYLVADGRLSGVLDWEFSAFGNPLEDVGWIFAKCWRFGANQYPVGGVANAADFLGEYETATGRHVDAEALVYWQVMAHLRWAVIALQQRERHRSGIEPSLELALTGHLISDFELEILALTTREAA